MQFFVGSRIIRYCAVVHCTVMQDLFYATFRNALPFNSAKHRMIPNVEWFTVIYFTGLRL